jgi:hypothetical protein
MAAGDLIFGNLKPEPASMSASQGLRKLAVLGYVEA